jgi:oligopeptide transport system substrate-binding protein
MNGHLARLPFEMRRLFIALACLVLFAGCEVGPPAPAESWRTDGELVTALASEPDTIDPQRASFFNEAGIVGMVFEPLLTFDPSTLALEPAAARALPDVSADGLTYTYHLRAGLTYSDGAAVLASDFVFAWTRLCDPAVAAAYAVLAFPIAGCRRWNELDPRKDDQAGLEAARAALGVRALDERTIEFRLTAPAASFPAATALWIGAPIRAQDLALGGARWTEPATYIGNGPFRLVRWEHRNELVFERNDRYRLPVRLARWKKVVLSDASVSRAAFQAGEIDAVDAIPASDAERESLLLHPDLVRSLSTCTFYIGFNTKRAPFDDQRVRLAFAKALDREDYVRSVDRTGRSALSLVPHLQPGHAHDDRIQSFDPAEARRLLAASTYGRPVNGRLGSTQITFPFVSSPRNAERVQWAVTQWFANLGVEVRPEPISGWGGPLIRRPQQEPQLYRLGWCEDYPDGQNWYQVFRSTATMQRTHFADPTFDALVDLADRERDPAERLRLYERASFVLSAAAPAAFLEWSEHWTLVQPWVHGYTPSEFDWDFAQLSLARVYVRK